MLMIAPTVTAINGQRSGPGLVVFLVQAANFGWRLHRDANRLADDCVDSINASITLVNKSRPRLNLAATTHTVNIRAAQTTLNDDAVK